MNQTTIAWYPKSKYLTHGKRYNIEWYGVKHRYIAVRNDNGQIKPYSINNFTKYIIEIDTDKHTETIL